METLLNRKGLLLFTFILAIFGSIAAQQAKNTTDVRTYLKDNYSSLQDQDLADLAITDQYFDIKSGVQHVYFQQQYQGIPIIESRGSLHFSQEGKLGHSTQHLSSNLSTKIQTSSPAITANDAVQAALAEVGVAANKLTISKTKNARDLTFAKGDYTEMDIPARLVYYPTQTGDLVLSWEIGVYTKDQNHYWLMYMDAASNQEIARRDLVIHCTFESHDHQHEACVSESLTDLHAGTAMTTIKKQGNTMASPPPPGANSYRVFDAPVEAPTFGGRTLVTTAGDPASSPMGWHNDGIFQHSITKGNNVFAYHDPGPAAGGIPAIGGLPGQMPLEFDFDADLSLPPATFSSAAITNLFYWNNLTHDIFYQYGFTEEAGNFQNMNFGMGGAEGDAVLAEAQDGSGVNNANFLTLADGLPGRMQMFLWTSVPLIDGDFDNGVILHEYGHGISTRLTGGPAATCLGGDEQSGEGWSDFFGMLVTMQPESVPGIFASGRGMGTYVVGEGTDGAGIRPAKYSTDFAVNSYTYGDLNNSEISAPHGVGFIWATMLWDMTANLVDAYGYDEDIVYGSGGNNLALELVVTGLKLQPCSPTFVEQRDAILAADQLLYGGANKCLIWEAFAKRGLGFSASSGTNARGDESEAFDMPPSACVPTVSMTTDINSFVTDGETMEVTINITNNAENAIGGVKVSNELPEGATVVSASRDYRIFGDLVRFQNMSIPANTTKPVTIVLSVDNNSEAELQTRDDLENGADGWTALPGLNQFELSTERAYSGDHSFFAANPDNLGNQLLTFDTPVNVTQGTHLRFAHFFNTEAGFDGGVVEVSNDGGITWSDLGPLFVENGYNHFVALTDNPLLGGFSFGDSSNGWMHSVADLSTFAGQTLQIRFRFASDVATAAEGWYIDDLEVVQDPEMIYNTAIVSMLAGAIEYQATDEILSLGSSSNALRGANSNTATQAANAAADGAENFTTTPINYETIKVSPNPTTDRIWVSTSLESYKNAQIQLLNAHGQILNVSRLSSNMSEVDLSQYPKGIYFIRIQSTDALISKRVVKN